ncbi:MFS transporter [Devosia sp. A449]
MSSDPDRWRIIAVFVLQALGMGAIQTRIPDVQVALGLNDAQLGMALMGLPAGALSVFLFSSWIIERFGPRRTVLIFLPIQTLAAAAIAVAPNFWAMAALFFVMGVGSAVTNIAMNVEADRIEAASGRRVMNTCHGAWSIGFLGVALLGSPIRGLGLSAAWHLGLAAPLVLGAMLLIVLPMRDAPERAHSRRSTRPRLAWPTLMTLALVGFGLGGELLEGAARSWSIIFLRDSFIVPAWVESLALPALLATMAIGRLLADRQIDRFGPVRVARIMSAIAFVGLCAVVFSPNAVMALLGFGLVGLGICVLYPLMLSGAAGIGDRPAAENVAAMTLVVQIISLGAPLLIGAVAQNYGIRFAFGMLLPLLALGWAMAGVLAPKTP